MKRRLTESEAARIRRHGLDLSDRHLQARILARLDLHKVKQVFEDGEVYAVGKHKYRAVLTRHGTTMFVIFERLLDNNVLKTVSVTRSKRSRWD